METDLRYLAGLFDGEGSISLSVSKGHVSLSLNVSNTVREPLDIFQSLFGGAVHTQTHNPRVCYQWQVRGLQKQWSFLLALLPHLRIKRRQAYGALLYLSTVGTGQRLSESAKTLRANILEAVRDLNQGKEPAVCLTL